MLSTACHAATPLRRCQPRARAGVRAPAVRRCIRAAAAEEEAHGDEDATPSMSLKPREGQSETIAVEPFEPVSSFCSPSVTSISQESTLGEAMPHFALFTGLPVVDELGHAVGILSDKDVAVYLSSRGGGDDTKQLLTPVRHVMSSPAITVPENAPIAFAAGLMLQHRVHRLPVVSKGRVVAMLSRTDVFKPLMPDWRKTNALYLAKAEKLADHAKQADGVHLFHLSSASQSLGDKLKKIAQDIKKRANRDPHASPGVEKPPFGP